MLLAEFFLLLASEVVDETVDLANLLDAFVISKIGKLLGGYLKQPGNIQIVSCLNLSHFL